MARMCGVEEEMDAIFSRYLSSLRALRRFLANMGMDERERSLSDMALELGVSISVPPGEGRNEPTKEEVAEALHARAKAEIEAQYGISRDNMPKMEWTGDRAKNNVVLDMIGLLHFPGAFDPMEYVGAILCGRPVSAKECQGYLDDLFGKPRGPCQHQWNAGEHAYRCKTCQHFPVTAICETCFHAGNHATHDYTIYVSGSGGSCDCGTLDAMKEEGFCPEHRVDPDEDPTAIHPKMPQEYKNLVSRLITHIILGQEVRGLVSSPSVFFASATILKELVALRPEFRRVICRDLASGEGERFQKLFHILADNDYPSDFLHLIVSLGVEPGFKTAYIQAYVNCIPSFVSAFLRTTSVHESETVGQKHLQLSVQAFACSTKVSDFLIATGAGVKLTQAILSVVMRSKRLRYERALIDPESEKLEDYVCNIGDPVIRYQVFWTLCLDLHNLLSSCKGQALHLIRDDVFRQTWLDTLGLIELMNKYQRKEGLHIMFDNLTWQSAIHLEIGCYLYPMITIDKWIPHFSDDELVPSLGAVLYAASTKLFRILSQEPRFDARCRLSFHLPLHCVIGIFSSYFVKRQSTEEYFKIVPPSHLSCFLDFPLRFFAAKAQHRVGMWVRNGVSLSMHLSYCFSPRDKWFTTDALLHLCQLGLMLLPAEESLGQFMSRFLIDRWLEGEEDAIPLPDMDLRRRVALLEDFLFFLITLFTDRTLMTPSIFDNVRKQLISLLVQAPTAHSRIVDKVMSSRGEEDSYDFEPVLHSVADFEPPTSTRVQGLFRLKTNIWSEYDPAYLAFHSFDRSALQAAQHQYASVHHLKEEEGKKVRCNFMDFPPLPENYKQLFTPLQDRFLHRHLALMLLRSYELSSAPEFSPTVVQAVLHLVRMALLHAPPFREDAAKKAKDVVVGIGKSEADGTTEAPLVFSDDHILANVAQKLALPGEDGKFVVISILELIMKFRGREDVADQAYLDTLLQLCRKSGSEVEHMIDEMTPDSSAESQAKARAAKRQKAQERQKALMAKFQRQQKKFLESEESEPAGASESVVDEEAAANQTSATAMSTSSTPLSSPTKKVEEAKECVICFRACEDTDRESMMLSWIMSEITVQSSTLENFAWQKAPPEGIQLRDICDAPEVPKAICKSCGHWVHLGCLLPYLRTQRPENTVFREMRYLNPSEFLCPMCRSLCNTYLPLALPHKPSVEAASEEWTFTPGPQTELLKFLQAAASRASAGVHQGDESVLEDFLNDFVVPREAFRMVPFSFSKIYDTWPLLRFLKKLPLNESGVFDDQLCHALDSGLQKVFPFDLAQDFIANVDLETTGAMYGARKFQASQFVKKCAHVFATAENILPEHELGRFAQALVAPDSAHSLPPWCPDPIYYLVYLIAVLPEEMVYKRFPELVQFCHSVAITQAVGSVICLPDSPALSHANQLLEEAVFLIEDAALLTQERISRIDGARWRFGFFPIRGAESSFAITLERESSADDQVECLVDIIVSFSSEPGSVFPVVPKPESEDEPPREWDLDGLQPGNQLEVNSEHLRRVRFPAGRASVVIAVLSSPNGEITRETLELIGLTTTQCLVLRHLDNFSRPLDEEGAGSQASLGRTPTLRNVADAFLATANACTDIVPKDKLFSVRIMSDDVWSLVEGPLKNQCELVSMYFLRRAAIVAQALFGLRVCENLKDTDLGYFARLLKLVPEDLIPGPEGSSALSVEKVWQLGGFWHLASEWIHGLQKCVVQRHNILEDAIVHFEAHEFVHQLPTPQRAPLVPLPTHYGDLLAKYRTSPCCVCSSQSESLALCLLCGSIACFSSRDRSCIRLHTLSCCGHFGLILAFYQSSVIVTSEAKFLGVWGSPYLDEYGEEDLGLKRGKRLILNEERYKRLQACWLNCHLEYECK